MIAEWDHCTQIALEPPSIEQTVGSGPVPVAAGGAITDGTYVLNSYSVFGASALTEDTGDSGWVGDVTDGLDWPVAGPKRRPRRPGAPANMLRRTLLLAALRTW